MVGGAASAEDRAKNAGRFRTVVGFAPARFQYVDKEGYLITTCSEAAMLDGDLFSVGISGKLKGSWRELPFKSTLALVKINPGDAEDETLTWAGLPRKRTQTDKEPV